MSAVSIRVGDLTYKAEVLPGAPPFDGYELFLIRYRHGKGFHNIAVAHYWTLLDSGGEWIACNPHRGEFINNAPRVGSFDWPQRAYEIATRVKESEARTVLEDAIRTIVGAFEKT